MYQSTTTSERLRQPSCERTESKKSILSAAASPVKMCHAPALEKALRTAMGKLLDPDYGENTHALLTSLDHNGSWLKMSEGCCQQVLISDREETSELFSGTWPTWGTMRFGRVMELKPLERHTRGKECSLWPTAVASDASQGAIIGKDDIFYTTSTGMPRKVNRNGTDGSVGLGRLVQMWRTPDANLGARGPKSAEMYEECKKTNRHAVNLLDQVKHECNWPTPCVADIFTANLKSTQQKPGSMHSVNLSQCVNWPTPAARDWEDSGDLQKLADSTHQACVPKMVAKLEMKKDAGKIGALNSDWVEILMGLPIGWTDIDCEEPQPWPGWPAPMNATQKWATPNCMDMLPSRSFEAMKHQATNGARKNRKLPGNLREQIDPLMRKAYIEASQENGGCLEEEITVSGQYPYEPPRVIVGQKNRAKRLKCLGNGCVPEQVAPIFKIIMEIEGAAGANGNGE